MFSARDSEPSAADGAGRPGSPVLRPGRYASIDVGSNSVLLIVADVDEGGRLTPVAERGAITRLGEHFFQTGQLTRNAMDRTRGMIAQYADRAASAGAEVMAAVGTSVLREAPNAAQFLTEVLRETGVEIEVIAGEREAELAYLGNVYDRSLPASDDLRIVVDIGGGSTEIVEGSCRRVKRRASFPLGAVRLTEQCLKTDPPTVAELMDADTAIQNALFSVDAVKPGSVVLLSGGTTYNLCSVARSGGLISSPAIHGSLLRHTVVAELVELFRSLPLKFKRRVPGLEVERADVILGGAMILHQVVAQLGVSHAVVTTNGVRHGCLLDLAARLGSGSPP